MFNAAVVQACVKLLIESERELHARELEYTRPEIFQTSRRPSTPARGFARWFPGIRLFWASLHRHPLEHQKIHPGFDSRFTKKEPE
jgi:hypothetical protein